MTDFLGQFGRAVTAIRWKRAGFGYHGAMPNRRPTPANVILIGFMASGKTSVGREVARLLGFEFVDTDALIVERAGKPITEIFEEVGEDGFRAQEAAVLGDLAEQENCAIATGGGIVTREENVAALRAAGMVIWLDLGVDAVMERVEGNTERPLLQTDDPRATVEAMMAERLPLYQAAADERADVEGLQPEELAYGIAESARVWFR